MTQQDIANGVTRCKTQGGVLRSAKSIKEYQQLKKSLSDSGWLTPDTYGHPFSPLGSFPAVYLFLSVRCPEFDDAVIAYVGMSGSLKQRILSHDMRPKIERGGYWIMTWFKPTSIDDLRKAETEYIKAFDPPWNIIGRPRGVIH